jgi:hypothetical protein
MITGFRRGSRRRKITDILFLRRWRRADWTAINPAAPHSNEELAVETRIARQSCSRTHPPIKIHSFSEPMVNHDRYFATAPTIIVDPAVRVGRFRTGLSSRRPPSCSNVRKRPACGIGVRKRPMRGHPFRYGLECAALPASNRSREVADASHFDRHQTSPTMEATCNSGFGPTPPQPSHS